MLYFGFTKLGDVEGGIKYDVIANSFIVWVRETSSASCRELTPAYGNGVAAENRLNDEILMIDERKQNGNS